MERDTNATPSPTAERRRDERYPMRLVARLAHPTGNIFGHLDNISGGGARFVTGTLDPCVDADTDVVLILTSPPNAISREVHCTARITRATKNAGDAGPLMAYGVEFDEPLELDVLVGTGD